MAGRIRVLIVDDSALMRQVLKNLLEYDPEIEVVGVAADPIIAWTKILQLQPDVLTLDVEMPRMDGLSFLERLMRDHPLPVVMISSLTERGCATTLRALELGAVDFVTKPRSDIRERLTELAQEVIEKIKAARDAHVVRPLSHGLRNAECGVRNQKNIGSLPRSAFRIPHSALDPPPLIALGASTGGTEAIRELLAALASRLQPADCPGMVVVQHMPPKFTRAFADRLNTLCELRVAEAMDGCRIQPGQVLIAPGDFHMTIVHEGLAYAVRIDQKPPVNRHRPSVDVLFHSCAEVAGRLAVGILLTGMGQDGARGLLEMRRAGARTLVQDEASSVVFGMPKAAIDLGAAEKVLPLSNMPEALLGLIRPAEPIPSL